MKIQTLVIWTKLGFFVAVWSWVFRLLYCFTKGHHFFNLDMNQHVILSSSKDVTCNKKVTSYGSYKKRAHKGVIWPPRPPCWEDRNREDSLGRLIAERSILPRTEEHTGIKCPYCKERYYRLKSSQIQGFFKPWISEGTQQHSGWNES